MAEKKRILLVAEAVTLAHVGRLITLAQGLDPSRYEIHFACDPRHQKHFRQEDAAFHPIVSVQSEAFLVRLADGKPVYTESELDHYVEKDLILLGALKPDLVVSDFRLSLGVSARKLGVPLINVTNAHWSPRAQGCLPLPENPVFRRMGWTLSSLIFRVIAAGAVPIALRHHATPMNRVRKRHGLPPLRDVREVYTQGDLNLFADTPGLVPLIELHSDEGYLGPVLWSPKAPLPEWWEKLDPKIPSIYVTLGSSGNILTTPAVIEALARIPAQILIATVGRLDLKLPPNCLAADYLPGAEACRRASLVICNGGSGTVYQALSAGVPVLGIVSNLDQAWTMSFVEKAGAGKSIRYWQARPDHIRTLMKELLQDPKYLRGAKRVSEEFARFDSKRIFSGAVAQFTA